ncbi:early transcribed membrane protein [Plasmodium gallinaceum]|uniref:Early transcribed membrane protein n=1 Tax=Plasmodium gallinaceum TaxID=5849 RepID=A0A1J1GR55_PLAGA|nr:early transcribed membrane protein [Plasmodium gallinaceum]CRG93522.1 early transcribed membrane protein [Plasmodium gallinaceum]
MKVSMILHLFNILVAINLLAPCFCLNKKDNVEDNNDIISITESIEKSRKKKIMYTCAALATTLAAVTGIALGIYFTRDKRRSVWENDDLGNAASEIIDKIVDEGSKNGQIALENGLDLEKVIKNKDIKNALKTYLEKSETKFSGFQKRELYHYVPFISHIIRHKLKNNDSYDS